MPHVKTLPVPSTVFRGERSAQVYLPPGYDPAGQYPAIYCCPGFLHFRFGFSEWLDEQIAAGTVAPCLAVGIDFEDGDDELDLYRFAATELVPAVEAAYGVKASREGRWLLGYSAGAGYVLELGALYSELFSKVAAQAPGWMIWSSERNEISHSYLAESMARIEGRNPGPMPDCWFVYGDADDPFEAPARRNGAAMMDLLGRLGARVGHELVEGGHGPRVMQKGWPLSLRFLGRG